MGYTERATGFASFNRAVMSLWFRIPAETLNAVKALSDDPGEDGWSDGWDGAAFTPPLFKVIPLITFGSIESTLGDAAGNTCSPSFIGVQCHFDDVATLAVNLQTAVTADFNASPESPESEWRPACFYMGGRGSVGNEDEWLIVTPDEWHHILVSFDISGTSSIVWFDSSGTPDPASEITPGPTFSWAYDDVGKVNSSMFKSGGENWDLDPEYIIPQQLQTIHVEADHDEEDFTISVSGCQIVQSGNPIGIPTTTEFVNKVYNIQMAEIQIFTGVTMDATAELNRRKFLRISGDTIRPASPALAAAFFGKQPEVYFQTHQDWETGNNRGTAGDFTPAGTILAYSDGP